MASLHRVLILFSRDLITRTLYSLLSRQWGIKPRPYDWVSAKERNGRENRKIMCLNLSSAGTGALFLYSPCFFFPYLFYSLLISASLLPSYSLLTNLPSFCRFLEDVRVRGNYIISSWIVWKYCLVASAFIAPRKFIKLGKCSDLFESQLVGQYIYWINERMWMNRNS